MTAEPVYFGTEKGHKYDYLNNSTKMLNNVVWNYGEITKALGITKVDLLNISNRKANSLSRALNSCSGKPYIDTNFPNSTQIDYAIALMMGIDQYIFTNFEDIRFQDPEVLDRVEDFVYGRNATEENEGYVTRFVEEYNDDSDNIKYVKKAVLDFANGIGLVNIFQNLKASENNALNKPLVVEQYYAAALSTSLTMIEDLFIGDAFSLLNRMLTELGMIDFSNSDIYISEQFEDEPVFSNSYCTYERFITKHNCVVCKEDVSDSKYNPSTPLQKELSRIISQLEHFDRDKDNILLFVKSEKDVSYCKNFIKKINQKHKVYYKFTYAWRYDRDLVIETDNVRTIYSGKLKV